MVRPIVARSSARLAAAALLGVAALFGGAPHALAQTATATVEVSVTDPRGILSEGDVELLRDRVPDLDLPPEVTHVDYIAFEENEEDLNDSVLAHAETHAPELLDNPEQPEETERWANGRLILAVGLDPRQAGVYCGDDVCAALELDQDARISAVVDAMGESFRDERYGPGFLEGTRVSADTSIRDEIDGRLAAGLAAAGATTAVVGGGLGVWGYRRHRSRQIAESREQYAEIGRVYGDVAGRLDMIDVRANSLTSPLADDRLRRDWADVRDRFLEVDSIVKAMPDITPETEDKVVRPHMSEIARAHTAVTQLQAAEDNIELLFKMENGDEQVRRRQLTSLHEDVLEARLGTKHDDLKDELTRVGERIDALRSDLGASDFMDRYTDLLGDYQVTVRAIEEREMSDVDQHADRTPPHIYESTWRPGYGYNNFAPYVMISSWHATDVAHHSSSGSGISTGYSSGGFSGGGGSGSF